MEIKVLEIRDKNAFLIKKESLEHYLDYAINGEVVSLELKKSDLVIGFDDELTSLSKSKKITDYRRGDEIMSIEEFREKPQYYDEDSSDEHTLRAIANKKELSGFEPHYEEPTPEKVDLKVVGFIDDTCSEFISCSVTNKYSQEVVLYTLHGNRVSMDEYNILKEEYKDHATFNKPDRNYLRFAKINNSYAFYDAYPFGDSQYIEVFSNLSDAAKEEQNIRDIVKRQIRQKVFKENLTVTKNIQISYQLKLIKQMRDKNAMKEAIGFLINDIEEYIGNIKS